MIAGGQSDPVELKFLGGGATSRRRHRGSIRRWQVSGFSLVASGVLADRLTHQAVGLLLATVGQNWAGSRQVPSSLELSGPVAKKRCLMLEHGSGWSCREPGGSARARKPHVRWGPACRCRAPASASASASAPAPALLTRTDLPRVRWQFLLFGPRRSALDAHAVLRLVDGLGLRRQQRRIFASRRCCATR